MPRYHHIEARSRHWGESVSYRKKHTPRFGECVLEAPPRFELGNQAFAELCLTTWLWCHASIDAYVCTLRAYSDVTGARDEIFASGSHRRASLPSTSRKLPLCGQPNSRMSRSTPMSVRNSRTSMSLERETRYSLPALIVEHCFHQLRESCRFADSRTRGCRARRLCLYAARVLRCHWSERRDSNSRHLPWQGNALPLSHSRISFWWKQ